MDPVWHRPCCKKTQNGVEIDHIVFAVQTAHFQSLSKAAISLNGMTVKLRIKLPQNFFDQKGETA
jgi:hypothetical protein